MSYEDRAKKMAEQKDEERKKKGKNPIVRNRCLTCGSRSYVHLYGIKEVTHDQHGNIRAEKQVGTCLSCPACFKTTHLGNFVTLEMYRLD